MFKFFKALVISCILEIHCSAYFLNATGGTFPDSFYQEATFSYQFIQTQDAMSYFAAGSAGGKCNIMGYWHTSNTNPNAWAPPKSILTSDQNICLDKCSAANPCVGWSSGTKQRWDASSRKPIVDIGASDALLSAADYKAFSDLQMFPAVAGAVVPIYNIPDLLNISSPIILTRNVLAQIFLGNIRTWNDQSILSVQAPNVKAILAHCNQTIKVVVRTDSSGTTDIFTTALSLFQPAAASSPSIQKDNSFSNVVGKGQTPTWCGKSTDEIQILTTTSCVASLTAAQRTIVLQVVTLQFAIRMINIQCDASAVDIRTAFEGVFGNGTMKVYRSQLSPTSYVFSIGYWVTSTSSNAPDLAFKNMYEPVILSTNSVGASLSTLQEGGYVNVHYNTSYSILAETQSIFVNASSGCVFTVSNPNAAVNPNGVSASIGIVESNKDYSSTILSAVNGLSSGLLASVSRVKHMGGFDEYQLSFNSNANIKQLTVNLVTSPSTATSNTVLITTLQHGSNFPIFYDAMHPQGYGNSGKYTCYRHDHNLTAWSYYTGSGNPGLLSEVTSLPYSIGYSVLTDAHRYRIPMASLINRAGNVIVSNATSVTYAVMEKGGSLDANFNAILCDGYAAKVWPISGYTYWIIRTNTHLGSCHERRRAMQFLYSFYTSDAVVQTAASLGFSTLPSFIRDIILKKLTTTVKCNNGQYVFNISTPAPLYLTDMLIGPMATYLTAFQQLDDRLTWNVSHADDSSSLWDSYLSSPSSVIGIATTFVSKSQKQQMYAKGAAANVITTAFAHVAIVPIYNLQSFSGLLSPLVVTPDILAKIYMGVITHWNDSAIQAVNWVNRMYLPFQSIIVVYRSTPSDANQIFTRYLALQSPAFAIAYAVGSDGIRSFDVSRFVPMSRVWKAKDYTHMDSYVSFVDGSIGYYPQIGSPNSAMADFCTNSSCTHIINPNNPRYLAGCEADTNTAVLLTSGTTFDFTLSTATDCYPIVATVDYSTFSVMSSSSCSQGLEDLGNLRMLFSSWLYNGTSVTAPLLGRSMQGSSSTLRQLAYTRLCDIPCNGRAMGYTYCAYRDCVWDGHHDGGDYRQIVGYCDKNAGKRTVKYVLVEGNLCIRPANDPLKSDVLINCDYLPGESAIGVACYVLMAFGTMTTIWVAVRSVLRAVEIMKKSKSRSHPTFLYIFLFGAVMLHLVIISYVGDISDSQCMAQVWFYNLSLTVMYGPLVMKLITVETIVYGARLKKVTITAPRVISEVLLLLAVDLLILCIWTIMSPPKTEMTAYTYSGVMAPVDNIRCVHGTVFDMTMLVWKCVLMGYGLFKAICTWHIPAAASESKQFAVALGIGLLSFATSKLFYIDPANNVFLQSLCNFLCSVLSVLLIMIPKLAEKIKERVRQVGSRASIRASNISNSSVGALYKVHDILAAQKMAQEAAANSTQNEPVSTRSRVSRYMTGSSRSKAPSMSYHRGSISGAYRGSVASASSAANNEEEE